MSQENRINDALKQLGEEYRLGMVNAEEFRGRRRALLQSWGDRDATTSPGASPRKASTTQVNPNRAKDGPGATPSQPQEKAGKGLMAGGVVVLLAAGLGAYFLLKKPAPVPGANSTTATPVVKRSPELLAAMRAAKEFLSRNRWELEDTEGFLAQWRTLSPADRDLARQEPSLQSLRYELEQNIQAEAQAMATAADAAPSASAGDSKSSSMTPAAAPSASAGDNNSLSTTPAAAQQERLDRLRAFAQELTGSNP